MRSTWTGSITVAVLSIPVRLCSASRDDSGMHLVRQSDGSPVKMVRTAEADGKEVPWGETGRAYTSPDGSTVVLSQGDLDRAFGPKNRVAEIVAFCDPGDIPPAAVRSFYWVMPGTGGERPYALLAAGLRQSGRVAVLRVCIRQRAAMAVLRACDGYMTLETLEWAANVLGPDAPAPTAAVTQAEADLMMQLIGTLGGKYDHGAQADPSGEALEKIAREKAQLGQAVPLPRRAAENTATGEDLVAVLTASVEAHKAAKKPVARARRKSTSVRVGPVRVDTDRGE